MVDETTIEQPEEPEDETLEPEREPYSPKPKFDVPLQNPKNKETGNE